MIIDNQAPKSKTLLIPDPESCFVGALVGGIGKGKSLLGQDLILNNYKGSFNRCITINPSAHLDKTFKNFLYTPFCSFNVELDYVIRKEQADIENEKRFDVYGRNADFIEVKKQKPHLIPVQESDYHDKYSIEIIRSIVDEQKYIIKNYGSKLCSRVLLFIDDATTAGCFNKSHLDELSRLVACCRHLHISIIFSVQKFKTIVSLIRENLTFIMFFDCSPTEMEAIHQIFDLEMHFKDWLILMKKLLEKDYDYIQINLRNRKKYRLIYKKDKFVLTR